MLRRAEEGVGESLSLPDFLSSQSNIAETHKPFQSTIAREKTQEVAPLPSLPSPPTSSPISLSTVISDDEPVHSESSARHSLQRSQSPPNTNPQRLFIASPSNIDETRLKSPHQRHSPPTFASLSSPTGSQTDEMMIDPPTPTFDSLVAQAVNVDKAQIKSHFTGSSPSCPVYDLPTSSQDSSTSSNNSFSGSSESLDSSRSQEFVEQELTQRMDIDEDTNEHKQSSPGEILYQGQPTFSIIPGVMNERTTPMPVRQAWYGTLPPRRSSLATPLAFGPESEMRLKLQTSHSTPSQSSKAKVNALPEQVLRSGTSRLSSAVNGREPASSSPQSYSHGRSQPPSQASSLEYASYPLQTQAPYQSQSYSP
ncbi:hypothetical protein C0993_000082 [Termitomyces sp. T159_Od127]|nr:hypothetical protein C0993_000082 [Termitomyces sp. T159_Od127]